MSEKKRIRPYTLKYWMGRVTKNMVFLALSSCYFIMAFYYVDSQLWNGEIVDLFRDLLVLGELEENVLINEILICGSQWGCYMSFLLAVGGIFYYRSQVMLPISMGSTRREAYVGYESGWVATLMLLNLHSLILAFISKEIAGESALLNYFPIYMVMLLLLTGMVKLLYALQFENNSKAGNLVRVALGLYILLAAIGIFVQNMFLTTGQNGMEGMEWLYVLMAFIGILTWFMGGKITLKKSKSIEVIMLFS